VSRCPPAPAGGWCRAVARRGGRSRNKVAVTGPATRWPNRNRDSACEADPLRQGEPAAGSPPKRSFGAVWRVGGVCLCGWFCGVIWFVGWAWPLLFLTGRMGDRNDI